MEGSPSEGDSGCDLDPVAAILAAVQCFHVGEPRIWSSLDYLKGCSASYLLVCVCMMQINLVTACALGVLVTSVHSTCGTMRMQNYLFIACCSSAGYGSGHLCCFLLHDQQHSMTPGGTCCWQKLPLGCCLCQYYSCAAMCMTRELSRLRYCTHTVSPADTRRAAHSKL